MVRAFSMIEVVLTIGLISVLSYFSLPVALQTISSAATNSDSVVVEQVFRLAQLSAVQRICTANPCIQRVAITETALEIIDGPSFPVRHIFPFDVPLEFTREGKISNSVEFLFSTTQQFPKIRVSSDGEILREVNSN